MSEKECCRDVLEKSVVEKLKEECCAEVSEKSVVEKGW